ncbi:MAG TPA: PIN domain-containing protein [Spirochaetes bacterium]|nr:PIN domain-containing protein [Spirochaetota bacterium]
MKFIFVDTNAWIALNSKRDHWHTKAVEINKQLLNEGFRYLTTSYVLDESYTGLRKVAHSVVVDFGERIQTSRLVQVIRIDEDIENLAWELFKQYSDKQFSFTDCTSFVVMKRFNLIQTFTNDRHFEQMGFQKLLK